MESTFWKILIVDDDEDDYLIARTMLAELHDSRCELTWAPTFDAGRKALQKDDYDAVLMDYDLGAGSGLELIREAVAQGRQYPIILLTGRGSREVDVEAMQAGATMYLTKNEVNPLLLERVIRYAIEMKQKELALKEREAHLQETSARLSRELSERERAEDALKTSEARRRESNIWLRLAFEATDLGTWQHDLQDNAFIFDANAQRHYGFDRKKVPFDETLAHIHPQDLPRLKQEIATTFDPSGDGRYTTEYRVIHPDGKLRHLAVQARVYFEGEGSARRPVLGVGTSQDITERKQTEQALARHAERQTLLLDVSREVLLTSDDLPSLTKTVFERVSPHLNADVAFNYQLETPRGPLKLVAGFGIPDEQWEASQHLELGQAFCGTVAATRQPLAADEARILSDEKGEFVRAMGVQAYACHPLFSRSGRVMGTLSLASTRRTSFSAEEIDFLQTLTHFVSLAWEQAGVEKKLEDNT